MRAETPVVFGRCPVCQYLVLPVLELSPCGHSEAPELLPMAATGTVYSWTRVWSGDSESSVIVMADFFDGRLRVTAPLSGDGPIAIGDVVGVCAGESTPYALSKGA